MYNVQFTTDIIFLSVWITVHLTVQSYLFNGTVTYGFFGGFCSICLLSVLNITIIYFF